MIEPLGPSQAPSFSVQMIDAHLYEASVGRRARTPEEPPEPTLQSGPRAVSRDDTKSQFSVLVGVDIGLPFGDELGAFAEIKFSVLGSFAYTGDLNEELFQVFPGREAVLMLWPYLRAAAAQLAGMTGLPIPVLPTLDVVAALNREVQLAPAEAVLDKPTPRRRRRKAAAPA